MIQLNQQKTQLLKTVGPKHKISFFPPIFSPLGRERIAPERHPWHGERGEEGSAWPRWLWGLLATTPFSFSPLWFHTSTPQAHFELEVQMNEKSQQSNPLLVVGELSPTA